MRNETIIDLRKLDEFRKNIKSAGMVRVGVLASSGKVSRPEGEITNPEIGFEAEFGSISKNIPIRSWLRMPITFKRKEIIKDMNNSKVVKKAIGNMDIVTALKVLGISAYNKVQEAFESKGFGKWAPNSPMTIAKKGSSSPLIDTSEFRNSVTWQVKEGKS